MRCRSFPTLWVSQRPQKKIGKMLRTATVVTVRTSTRLFFIAAPLSSPLTVKSDSSPRRSVRRCASRGRVLDAMISNFGDYARPSFHSISLRAAPSAQGLADTESAHRPQMGRVSRRCAIGCRTT